MAGNRPGPSTIVVPTVRGIRQARTHWPAVAAPAPFVEMGHVKRVNRPRPVRRIVVVVNSRSVAMAPVRQVNRPRPVRPTAVAVPGVVTNSVALIRRAIPVEPVPMGSSAPGMENASPLNPAKRIVQESSAGTMAVGIVATPARPG